MSDKLRILVIGAHPDDCEITAGGTATMWAAAGHTVRFISATNGQTGHHVQGGVQLTQRRIAEAANSARVLGVENEVLPIPSNQIDASVVYRWTFVRLIRQFKPDLILTHRPNDYHPDHRYTAALVQDSAYVVTVPNVVPETPALLEMPVIAYVCDKFQRPYPFTPDVVIDIDAVVERKLDALHQHTSQMYEWLAFNEGVLDEVPAGDADRRRWLAARRTPAMAEIADRFRPMLKARYGDRRGGAVKFAEAFEGCEYGKKLDAAQVARLFGGL